MFFQINFCHWTQFCCWNKKIPSILEFFGISGISPQIPQICQIFPNWALFQLKLKPQNGFWRQKGEICKISLIWNLDSSDSKINSKLLESHKFLLFDIRIRSGTSIWVGKVSYLGRKAKYVIFVEKFHRFQKIPEFLEFFDSDSRIGFSDNNWVGKMPHIVILAKNGRIMSQIGNRLIKISWNQLIFYSDQSWSKSHLYWIYSWFLKIPVATLLFGHFYGPIKWLDWPSFSEKAGLCWFFIRKSKKAIRGVFHLWPSPTHTQNGVSKFQGPGLGRGPFGL